MSKQFQGLKAIVQYRTKTERGGSAWINMAAFDMHLIAEEFAHKHNTQTSPWEYRVIDVVEEDE
jgi:hypothetical protein